MAKQLNVNLAFNADTKQVKSQLLDLQKQLDKIMQDASQKGTSFGFTKELQEASQAAASLKAHLDQATNVNTGKLDLGLLNKSFKDAGVTLDQYREKLQKIGPSGEQAFNTLASSILKAEMPLKQTNGLLHEFATTLKNTARWQISSSILHGFMGSLQSAFYYAQDLNESLNNIRIVTGKSTDEMADFAEQANKAAKALSTTTTEYTDAALIYYQQGLSDSEVTERTDTTVKLANVARESAEDVSQQMTAIWNNFDDGSKALEYYADVVTALGAATASSSAEIAEGLEKFAAVADTVGLSYEYATAALATVTATTRQSADIVGNAFKTLFARLEGLNLGETLDDGTDLNKYSEALDKVGINIKTVSGEMKSMDQILDELGSKWNTLSKDQQIALAQTVAGVRQYTQLVALMDNWDFFQQNLSVAQGAEGSLQKQADIYAESWEAAKDRVTASAEEIYNQLLNDDFFINLNNAFAGFLDLLSKTIDSIGGVQGAIALLGNVLIKTFSQDISSSINKFIYNLQDAKKVAKEMREQALSSVTKMSENSDLGTVYQHIAEPQEAYIQNAEKMTEIERRTAEILLSEHEARVKELAELNKIKAEAEKISEYEQQRIKNQMLLNGASETQINNYEKAVAEYQKLNTIITKIMKFRDKGTIIDSKTSSKELQKVSDAFKLINTEGVKFSSSIQKAFNVLKSGTAPAAEMSKALETLYIAMDNIEEAGGLDEVSLQRLKTALTEGLSSEERAVEVLQRLTSVMDEAAISSENFVSSEQRISEQTNNLTSAFENVETKPLTIGERFANAAEAVSSFAISLSMIKGLIDTLNNEDMSFGEKIIQVLITSSMLLPTIITLSKALTSAKAQEAIQEGLLTIGVIAEDAARKNLIATETAEVIVEKVLEAGSLSLAAALGIVAAAFAVVIAVGAAVTAVYKNYQKSLETTARAEVDQTNRLKEEQDSLVETKNNIVSLTESYDELTSKVKTNSDFTNDLRTQVFDLCNQYELYDLAIEALTEDYDQLTESIKKAQAAQDEKIIEAGQKTQASTQSAIESQIWANLGFSERDKAQGRRSIDIGVTNVNNRLAETLEEFGVDTLGFGHVDLEQFVKAATEEHDAFIEALEKNGTEQAQTLIDIINENQELFSTYTDSVSQVYEAQRDQAGLANAGNISSYQDYANAIQNITEQISDTFADEENPEESARKYAETWLSAYDSSFSEYAKRYALTETIADAIGEDLESVNDELSKYGVQSLAFIAAHTEQIKQSGQTLEKFTQGVQEYLDIADNIEDRDSVVGLLQAIAGGEEYNETDLTNLFSEESNFGMSQDEFNAMTQGEQTVALLNYFSENQQVIEENKEKTLQELEEYKEKATAELSAIDAAINTIKATTNADSEDYFQNLFPELDDKYIEIAERISRGEEETFDQNEKIIANFLLNNEKMVNAIEVRKEALEKLDELYESRDNLIKEISGYEAEAEALDEATSAVTSYKAAHEDISAISKDIDNIQSAYSSLNTIVETYNKNNGFTLDTLQSLLSLDPIYLQALEMNGDQLSINTDYLIELTKARLEDTKALVYEEGYNKLVALAEKDNALAAELARIGAYAAGDAAKYSGDKAEEAAEKWNKYTESLGGSISKEQQAIIDDTEKRIQSIDNVINNLDSSSFKKIASTSKSSSSGSKEKKDKKILEDEIDRYYDLNNAIQETTNSLEQYNSQLDKLNVYQDHYKGATLVKSLKAQNQLIEKQNELLNTQIANYKALAEEQSNELDDLKATLETYGAVFEGDVLINYTQVMADAINAYNDAVDKYNNSSEKNQDNFKDIEKRYEKLKTAVERYQDLYYTDMVKTQQDIEDALQQQLEKQLEIIENNLKAWEVEIDLKLDTTKLKREWRSFIKEVEQDFRKVYKNLTLDSVANKDNFTTYLDDVSTRIQQIADVEAEIRKMNASKDSNGVVQLSDDMMFGSISEAQEYLKELQSELVETGSSLKELYEQIWDNYIEGLNQAADNFEDISKQLDHLTNELEYEKQLIELIYGDEAYDLMNKYYETQQRNIENQINSVRTQALFWEEQFNKAYQMNKDSHSVNLDDMSTWTEDMQTAYENMIESQEKLNDLVIEGIETLRDEYLNNISKTLSELDKAIWGMDFDDLKEDWDFIQKKAEEYLDDVEGAYKIQVLANKIDQSIADTASLKAQQKLAKLREEEIEMLREKENLTQSDIDLAEARYQIALKEIALEEAQNNKTSMKLTRDDNGNWTYQYVADNDEILSKQQELLDAYNNLYEIADEAYEHAMELSMEMYEEYKEKVLAIAEDITLTEEEKMIKIQELQDLYLPEIQAAMENAQIYEQETIIATAAVFAEVCAQDEDAYTTLTDLQKELVDSVRDQHLEDYEDIRNAIINNYEEIGEVAKETFEETNLNSKTAAASIIRQWDKNTNDSVKGAMNEAYTALQRYTQNFENELYNLESISGKTIMDAGGVVSDVEAIGTAMDEVANKTQDMADTATSNLDTLRGFVNEVENAWNEVISKIQEAISAVQEYLSIAEGVTGVSSGSLRSSSTSSSGTDTGTSSSSSGSGSSSKNGGSNKNTGVYGNAHWDGYSYYTDPNGVSGTLAITKDGSISEIIGYDKNKSDGVKIAINEWAIKQGYHQFDTGGYTGDWGSQSGRLAVLHEKELVLNSTDTENMLDAVQTIRDIAGLNDSISQTIANSIGQLMLKSITANSGNNINTTSNSNTSNIFHVTAEFPNADDVQTIKDAILSLPNIASQFIHEN